MSSTPDTGIKKFVVAIDRSEHEKLSEALKRNGMTAASAFRLFLPEFLRLIDLRKPRRGKSRAT